MLESGADSVYRKDDVHHIASLHNTYHTIHRIHKSNDILEIRLVLRPDIAKSDCIGTQCRQNNASLKLAAVIARAENIGGQSRAKHIDLRHHFIQDKVEAKEIQLIQVASSDELIPSFEIN